jgi:hypothetical protein
MELEAIALERFGEREFLTGGISCSDPFKMTNRRTRRE